MKLTFLDGKNLDFPLKKNVGLINYGTYGNGSIEYGAESVYLREVAEQTGNAEALAVKINGELRSLDTLLAAESTIEFIMPQDKLGQEMLARSGLFLLGYALKRRWGDILRMGGSFKGAELEYRFEAGSDLADNAKDLLQQDIDELLLSPTKITAHKLPFYSCIAKLQASGEKYLVQQIMDNDDGGPIEALLLDDYFAPTDGIAAVDLRSIKAVKINEPVKEDGHYLIKAEIVM